MVTCKAFDRFSPIAIAVPGIYVRSLMIGPNVEADTENGFFMNVNSQVEEVCAKLKNDTKLRVGIPRGKSMEARSYHFGYCDNLWEG